MKDNSYAGVEDLKRRLWSCADLLRGTAVDRTDWKAYILPLVFYKRICDVWDEENREAQELYGDVDSEQFEEMHRFVIPKGCHWNDVRSISSDVGEAIAKSMREIERANPERLFRVFGSVDWGNKEILSDEILKDLLEEFATVPLGNDELSSDILGDAYEYLVGEFADVTRRKKAGEFYTPRSVIKLMVEILDPQEGETIYDPACGTGGMLLAAIDHVERNGGDPRTFYGNIFGQEKNLNTSAIARMNLVLHGVEDFDIAREDTLRSPAFTDSSNSLATFDCVIANPPFSLKEWGREEWESDPWGRNRFGVPPNGNGDYAWLQHMIASMNTTTGRLAVVLPNGALIRSRAEGNIRRQLIQTDLIETVISLVDNLFYGTNIPASILILKADKKADRRGKILMINAEDLFRSGRAKNFFDPEHIQQVAALEKDFKTIPYRTKVIDTDELEENEWSLNPLLYVEAPINESMVPFDEAHADFEAVIEAVGQTHDRLLTTLDRAGLIND